MVVQAKPKMHLLVRQAKHFLRWELPLFAQAFELVDEPATDAILFAYGPDVLELGASLPAQRRVAMMFPGFGLNPYHNLEYRAQALAVLERDYDLFFVNPGPLEVAYQTSSKMVVCNFTVDTALVGLKSYRTSLNSLVHVSSDYPQKDWPRSEQVMQLTGLKFEVFPPRGKDATPRSHALRNKINGGAAKLGLPMRLHVPPPGYVDHKTVVRKYQQYDGFVHVAAEVKSPIFIDGKYTACLIEAGMTGSILFWHDTFNLGNGLETVFNLPVEPAAAAQRILEIREGLNVKEHSRLTRQEMLDTFAPSQSVNLRCAKIKELI